VKDGKVPKGLQLYEQGLEEYPKPEVIFDNALMLVWIALGALGCYFLHPVATWAYLVLRKLVHKWPRCALRVGALSALLFKQGGMIKIAPVVYGLLTLNTYRHTCHLYDDLILNRQANPVNAGPRDFGLQRCRRRKEELHSVHE